MTINKILSLLQDILVRLVDVQQRNARIETRLFKLAEGLDVSLKRDGDSSKEDWE